ncbi:hypothetical protein Tco_0413714, partial [Tanacetum coccineum]
AFGFYETPYLGGRAPRTKVVGQVFTANEAPPEDAISFHHEMSYCCDNAGQMTNVKYDMDTYVELVNGDLVPEQAMKDCLRLKEEECVVVPWKKGDVLCLLII